MDMLFDGSFDPYESFARSLYRKRRSAILPARAPRREPNTFFDIVTSELKLTFSDLAGPVIPEAAPCEYSIPAVDEQAVAEPTQSSNETTRRRRRRRTSSEHEV